MEYEHINSDEVKDQALISQARQLDQQATAAEFEATRAKAMADEGDQRYIPAVETSATAAAIARKEADAFIKASNIDPQELVAQRQQFLVNLITNFETGYCQQEAIRAVKKDAGLPVADMDSNMVELEVGKSVASDMLGRTATNRQQRRQAARAAGKTGNAQ